MFCLRLALWVLCRWGQKRWGTSWMGSRAGELRMTWVATRTRLQGPVRVILLGPRQRVMEQLQVFRRGVWARSQSTHIWASHSALLKEVWRPAGIGDGSCFQSTSSSLMTSVASEAFWRAEGSLLSGHTGPLHGTIRALDVLFLWDLAAAEGRPTCLFFHCPLVLHSGRGLFSLLAFGVCPLISKTPLNLDKPSYSFTFHSCTYFYITFWFFIFFWKGVYF